MIVFTLLDFFPTFPELITIMSYVIIITDLNDATN